MHYEQNRSDHPRRHNNTNSKIYLHHLLFIFCVIFLPQLKNSQVEAKPMRILRLEADQMREILRYIYSQEGREGKQPTELEEEGNEKPGKVKETNMPANKNPALSEEKDEKEMESDAKGKLDDVNPWKAINLSTPVVYTLEDQSEKKKHDKRKEEGKCQLEAGQATQLQKKVRHFLHSQLQHIWTDQFVQVLGMNVSIAGILARHVRAPHIRLQPICSPNGQFLRLMASLTGGSLTLRANYRSVYRTVRTGHLRVRLGQFRAKVGEGAEEERGKCAVDVGRLEVRFRQRLLEEVDQAVADQLRDRIRHLICNRLPVFLRQESRR